MKNQRKDEEDQISQLPDPLLQKILCYLSQKQAVQTCVLSKSWRHLGHTRPKIEFRKDFFNGKDEEKSLSVLEKSLQRYHDQNLSIQEFIIAGIFECPESFELLEKWVPIVLQHMGVNIFTLLINFKGSLENSFRLPSSVLLKAKFLKEFLLQCCQISPLVDDIVLCKHLRKLRLKSVSITDATLEKIISSCPFIEDLAMLQCKGFKTIKMTKAPNLKFFYFLGSYFREEEDCHSIEIIDAPSIESINIAFCPSLIQNYFPRLKSLCLYSVRISNEIDKFSTNLPSLEKLTLSRFSDSEQFKLSSRTIKHLTIEVEGPSMEAVIIDATNILCFEFSCHFVPSLFSFTTTSTEWKSVISVGSTLEFDYGDSSMFNRLSEIFKALSTSQISLHIKRIPQVVPDYCGVVLLPFEDLRLEEEKSFSSVPDFLNGLFCNFRPRNIEQIWYADHHPFMCGYNKRENQLIEFLCKILLSASERAQYFGQQNLEDVKMEASYEKEEEWRGVEGTSSFSEFIALPWNSLKIRFRLKWRIE